MTRPRAGGRCSGTGDAVAEVLLALLFATLLIFAGALFGYAFALTGAWRAGLAARLAQLCGC